VDDEIQNVPLLVRDLSEHLSRGKRWRARQARTSNFIALPLQNTTQKAAGICNDNALKHNRSHRVMQLMPPLTQREIYCGVNPRLRILQFRYERDATDGSFSIPLGVMDRCYVQIG